MSEIQINLVCCTQVICDQVAIKQATHLSYVAATLTILGLWAILALLGIAPCIIARRSDNERKRRPF